MAQDQGATFLKFELTLQNGDGILPFPFGMVVAIYNVTNLLDSVI